MAFPKLAPALMQEAVALVRQHGSVNAAAAACQIPYSTFNRRWLNAKRAGLADDITPDSTRGTRAVAQSDRLPISVDECFAVLDAAIGRRRVSVRKPPKWRPTDQQRLVIAGDFHAPFHDVEAVAALVAEADNADTLVINGDLLDFYSISRFLKYEHVPIEQELAAADALLAQLAGAFADIVIVDGNHDGPRFEKVLRGSLTPEMVHVIEFLTGGTLSAVHALARRYPNIRFAPITAGRFKLGWAAQLGDLVVTHAEKYSKVPGAALRGIDEWFTDQEHTLDLKPWKVLVQAHTHQGGVFPWKADRLLVEGGCMCAVHGYQLSARIAGRPQRRGYVTLTQHKGVTDLDTVRFRWLDPALRRTA